MMPRYTRHWVYFALAILLATFWYVRRPTVDPQIIPFRPATDATPISNWFFVLQFPNPPIDNSGEIHRRITDWITSLRRSGFQPMLLSDVKSRFLKRALLPDKAVVITLDEGLLSTYRAYSSLLRDFRVPAVLTVREEPLRAGDRGFLSTHKLERLPYSGYWDVILIHPEKKTTLLSGLHRNQEFPTPAGQLPWATDTRTGFTNYASDIHRPKRLYVPWQWSGQDLIHRLQAEAPLSPHGSMLGTRWIANHLWGVLLPESQAASPAFTFQAAKDRRTADLSWIGTRGVSDFEIDFSLENLVGECWFLLRSTGADYNNIRVGFLGNRVVVEETIQGSRVVRGQAPWKIVFPWAGTIRLVGNALSVHQESNILLTTAVQVESTPQSMLQVLVYEQLFGAGRIENMRLRIIPKTLEGHRS